MTTIDESVFSEIINDLKKDNKDALLVQNEEGVLKITMNRPEKFNSISIDIYLAIADALNKASYDDNIKVVIISGNGKNFCTGNDLTNFMKLPEKIPDFLENEKARLQSSRWMAYYVLHPFVSSFINCSKPIIAVVQGLSIGIGFTFLGLCDFIYCSQDAIFYGPFVQLAQGPEACSSYTFHRIMGKSKANELLYLGEKMTAKDALENHFVSKVLVNHAEALKYASEKADTLKNYDFKSLLSCKKLIMEEERKILKQVNERELENLVERWASENLIPTLAKSFFAKKGRSKL